MTMRACSARAAAHHGPAGPYVGIDLRRMRTPRLAPDHEVLAVVANDVIARFSQPTRGPLDRRVDRIADRVVANENVIPQSKLGAGNAADTRPAGWRPSASQLHPSRGFVVDHGPVTTVDPMVRIRSRCSVIKDMITARHAVPFSSIRLVPESNNQITKSQINKTKNQTNPNRQ
jgi:hypothetical protein